MSGAEFSGNYTHNIDPKGRVLLPAVLRQKAGMDKAIRFAGMGRWLEIWDEDRFAETCEKAELDIGALLDYVNDRYYSNPVGGNARE